MLVVGASSFDSSTIKLGPGSRIRGSNNLSLNGSSAISGVGSFTFAHSGYVASSVLWTNDVQLRMFYFI